jgi:hypothetical protein
MVSRGLVLSGCFGGSLCKDLLVGDRGEHVAAAVASPVVVGVDEAGDLPAGLVLGGEVPAREQLVLEGRVDALRGGVVQRLADPSHRLAHPQCVACPSEHVAGVLGRVPRALWRAFFTALSPMPSASPIELMD